MKNSVFLSFLISIFLAIPSAAPGKGLPKFAVWDLVPRNIPATHAQELTSILVSEISKMEKYEVYSQENVRTLAGWTAERIQLGCTDTKCLTALGHMDIAKLISGSVGKIGNTYSISLNLFDTQNARAENAISEFCRSEDELITLVQQMVPKLLGVQIGQTIAKETEPKKPTVADLEAKRQKQSSKIWKASGTVITYEAGNIIKLKAKDKEFIFYLASDVKIRGEVEEGSKVTVSFIKDGDQRFAIVISVAAPRTR